jgi:hypothetical protein
MSSAPDHFPTDVEGVPEAHAPERVRLALRPQGRLADRDNERAGRRRDHRRSLSVRAGHTDRSGRGVSNTPARPAPTLMPVSV